ncbi:unnamed protein product [Rotaria socialis]|uniref:ADP ribosyltransferase domain-containing protein n=1 Tax=Rotaria socialis TaxID=392032 RepID=A0A817TUT4_9BILA|nr:unnamed protein product [Rotaria socialis]
MASLMRVLWLSSDATSNMPKQLRKIIPDLSTHSNLDDCVDNICSISSIPNSIILVVSSSFSKQTAELIDYLPQLRAIYIYCCDTSEYVTWAAQYSKIGFDRVLNQENDLIMRLTSELQETTIPISSSSMNSNETQMARKDERVVSGLFARSLENNSTRDLTEEKMTFIWLQILTNVLIYMPKLEEDAQNEMIVLCRQENKNDQTQLKLIEEFSNEYKLSEAIRCDVYRQINDLFTPIIDKLRSFRVYRGQNMSISELETLRGNVGGVISTNSFVSTSREENDALCFIQGAVPEPGFAIVLFEMAIDTRIAKIADTPFANIQDHSYTPDEEEILLSMGTIFRIDSIEREQLDASNIWRIKTTMCTINDDPQVNTFIKILCRG